jgi:2'-5' RNA ligase
MGESVRAFLAVQVSPAIHSALVKLKSELAQSGAQVRWVRDDGLHATVKFLGSCPQPQLQKIAEVLSPALVSITPFEARVCGLGAFPNLRRPRVLWVGMHASALRLLASTVETALEPLGFTPEKRPFSAHVTLGRVNGMRGWPRLEESLKAHRTDDFGTCQISELTALRSDLRPGGSVYSKLWTIALGQTTRGQSHGS